MRAANQFAALALLRCEGHAFVGEEIHRMARLVVNFTIVENLVAIKTAHVAVFQRDPIVEPLCWRCRLAQVVFADQGGRVSRSLSAFGNVLSPSNACQLVGQSALLRSSSHAWTPCCDGIFPVSTEARQGEQNPFGQNALSKVTPFADMASRCGVCISALP